LGLADWNSLVAALVIQDLLNGGEQAGFGRKHGFGIVNLQPQAFLITGADTQCECECHCGSISLWLWKMDECLPVAGRPISESVFGLPAPRRGVAGEGEAN